MSHLRTWKDVKNYLCDLIKNISAIHGGDESTWLNGYIDNVIELYKTNLKVPIECFEKLIQQAKDCGWIKYDYSALGRFMETANCPQPKK